MRMGSLNRNSSSGSSSSWSTFSNPCLTADSIWFFFYEIVHVPFIINRAVGDDKFVLFRDGNWFHLGVALSRHGGIDGDELHASSRSWRLVFCITAIRARKAEKAEKEAPPDRILNCRSSSSHLCLRPFATMVGVSRATFKNAGPTWTADRDRGQMLWSGRGPVCASTNAACTNVTPGLSQDRRPTCSAEGC